jgi:hypothetical protein
LPAPLQQAAADLRLEIAYPLGDRGLAHVQGLGSPREAAMPGNGRKQAEQMKVQRHNLSLCEKMYWD